MLASVLDQLRMELCGRRLCAVPVINFFVELLNCLGIGIHKHRDLHFVPASKREFEQAAGGWVGGWVGRTGRTGRTGKTGQN